METSRRELRNAATDVRACSTVSPGTKRWTTARVIGNRSAVLRNPSDLAAARMAGRATPWKMPIASALHVGVGVVGRPHGGLLDRRGGRPAKEIKRRTGRVVGAGPGCPAERLLPDDGACGFVVDVEVA